MWLFISCFDIKQERNTYPDWTLLGGLSVGSPLFGPRFCLDLSVGVLTDNDDFIFSLISNCCPTNNISKIHQIDKILIGNVKFFN